MFPIVLIVFMFFLIPLIFTDLILGWCLFLLVIRLVLIIENLCIPYFPIDRYNFRSLMNTFINIQLRVKIKIINKKCIKCLRRLNLFLFLIFCSIIFFFFL